MIEKHTVATFEAFVAPVIALNKIALGYTEWLVEFNLNLMRKQTDVALAGWRQALSIKGADEVKEYLTHQGEVAREVVEGYVADAKAVTALNQEVTDDLRKVVEEVSDDVRMVVEESITKASKQAA